MNNQLAADGVDEDKRISKGYLKINGVRTHRNNLRIHNNRMYQEHAIHNIPVRQTVNSRDGSLSTIN